MGRWHRMEYGEPVKQDNQLRSTLVTGAVIASGVFALGKKLRPWAIHELAKDASRFHGEVGNLLNNQSSLDFAEFAIRQRSKPGIGQTFGLAAVRGSLRAFGKTITPMRSWEKFAQTNQIARLVDELGFVRELREGYSAGTPGEILRGSQSQYLGPLNELGIFRNAKAIPNVGISHSADTFYHNGKLYAQKVSESTGVTNRQSAGYWGFKELPGNYWLYAKAGKGETRSVIEKATADLTGATSDINTMAKIQHAQMYNYAMLLPKSPGMSYADQVKFAQQYTHTDFKASKIKSFDKKDRTRAKELSSSIKGLEQSRTRHLDHKTLLGKTRHFFDAGLNERGKGMWTGEWWDQYKQSLLGQLRPEDLPVNRQSIKGYDVIQNFEPTKLKSYKDALFGGRNGQINTATLANFWLLNRINTAVAWNGIVPWLALSGKSASSPASFLSAVMLKRALPLYATAFYAGYANNQIGEHTGERPSDRVRGIRANTDLWWAGVKDKLGISEYAKHLDELSSGMVSHIAHPFIDTPVGLSKKELKESQETSDIGVRKGRWWLFGSSTPFRGERISYFTPNYTRYAKAGDLDFTDTLYGSADEYYANAQLPTPNHPFAPIRHFITDRYHYEEKHYRDRPYPLTSPLFEPTSVHGAILNPLLGWLLKPTKIMHEDEMPFLLDGSSRRNPRYRGEIKALNEEIKEQARSKQVTGLVTPSGMITPMSAISNPNSTEPLSRSDIADMNADIIDAGEEQDDGYDEGIAKGSYGDGARSVAPYGSGKVKARTSIKEANTKLRNRISDDTTRFNKDRMLVPASLPGAYKTNDPNDPRVLKRLIRSDDLRYQAGLAYYSLTEIGGIYGFGAVTATGDLYLGKPTVQNAGRMTSFERKYWDNWNLGGLAPTTGLSEAFRRFLPHRAHQAIDWTGSIPNTMPSWLPGSRYGEDSEDPAYFLNFQVSDPYSLIPNGETRLPSKSYELLHGISSGVPPGIKDARPGEYYSDLTKFSILADVAPWSSQYRRYRDYLVHSDLSKEDRTLVNSIKKQVTARKKRFTMSPYKVKYSDLDYSDVTVKDVIDNNTFTTYEHPDNPIRLAGVHINASDESTSYISKTIHPGAKLRIGIASDSSRTISHDTLHTMRAVVYSHGEMINKSTINSGYGKERDENNPAGIHVKYTNRELAIGGALEYLGHLSIPVIHNKFMPIDSPLELYSRTQVYGKDWQDWRHPFRDYLFPSIEAFAQQGIPGLLGAGYLGYAMSMGTVINATKPYSSGIFSYLSGLRPTNRTKIIAGFMGAVEGLSIYRHMVKPEDAVPSHREKERNIDEYFDILKYIKYEGLYEGTNTWIKHHQHHDLSSTVNKYKQEGEERKRTIQILKTEKRKLIVSGKKDKPRIKEINTKINELQNYRKALKLSKEDVLALQYKQQADQTLYGASDISHVLMALPAKEREFFSAFLKAPGAERERILRVVPKDERRFLESAWGMQAEKKPDLQEYFKTHFLPNADWVGWHADSQLSNYKLVVYKQEGLDMTSAGFWPQDEERVQEANTRNLKPMRSSPADFKNQLHRSLTGMGLRDIDIDVQPNRMGQHKIDIQIDHDRRDEIRAQQV